jgi:exosome complex component CSL4
MKVLPGQLLGTLENQGGDGTFTRNNLLYSSLYGTKQLENNMITVHAKKQSIPKEGDSVIARVARISRKQVNVEILVVNDSCLNGKYEGVINERDVSTESIEIQNCYRPGDIILAKVLAAQEQIKLSTQSLKYGVLIAFSHTGHSMVPISNKEMQCPETLITELRKCAKPDYMEIE